MSAAGVFKFLNVASNSQYIYIVDFALISTAIHLVASINTPATRSQQSLAADCLIYRQIGGYWTGGSNLSA